MRLFRNTLVTLLLATLLAACQFTVTPLPGVEFDYTVDAQPLIENFDELAALEQIAVPAGGEVWIRVRFPSSSADLRFAEAEPLGSSSGLQLEWWTSNQSTRLLVSRSPAMFAPSTDVLVSHAPNVGPVNRTALPTWQCFGPCIARPYQATTAAVRVVNTSGSTRTIDFYAYGIDHVDTNEPNDSAASATLSPVSNIDDVITGAVETSGDNDYFEVTCSSAGALEGIVRFQFDSQFPGDLVLTALGADDVTATVRPGDPLTPFMQCPVLVRVRAVDNTAGPFDRSVYFITIK